MNNSKIIKCSLVFAHQALPIGQVQMQLQTRLNIHVVVFTFVVFFYQLLAHLSPSLYVICNLLHYTIVATEWSHNEDIHI